jgi:hypothetical protein
MSEQNTHICNCYSNFQRWLVYVETLFDKSVYTEYPVPLYFLRHTGIETLVDACLLCGWDKATVICLVIIFAARLSIDLLFSLCLKYCILRIQSAFKKESISWMVLRFPYTLPIWQSKWILSSVVMYILQLILTQVKPMRLPTAFPNPVYRSLYYSGAFTNLKGRLPYKQEYNGKWTTEVSRVMMECGCMYIFFFLISFVSPLFSWTVLF